MEKIPQKVGVLLQEKPDWIIDHVFEHKQFYDYALIHKDTGKRGAHRIYKKPLSKKEITINRDWYDKLVIILDNLNRHVEIDDKCVDTHGWLSHLNGYVHSLDEHFKE